MRAIRAMKAIEIPIPLPRPTEHMHAMHMIVLAAEAFRETIRFLFC
jgi:hypothetical protein